MMENNDLQGPERLWILLASDWSIQLRSWQNKAREDKQMQTTTHLNRGQAMWIFLFLDPRQAALLLMNVIIEFYLDMNISSWSKIFLLQSCVTNNNNFKSTRCLVVFQERLIWGLEVPSHLKLVCNAKDWQGNTGLWLVNTGHVTWILACDWLPCPQPHGIVISDCSSL